MPSLAIRVLLPALLVLPGACQWRDGFVVLGDTTIAPPAAAQVGWVEVGHRVAFAPSSAKLSRAETSGLDAFLARASVGYGDRVVITAAPNAPKADERIEAVRHFLSDHRNLPVAIARQPASTLGQDEVQVAVGRYQTVSQACPDWDRALSGGGMNGGPESFGCVTSSARAAHAVDPGDLLSGDAMGPADGDLSALGVRLYRVGRAGALGGGN